MSLPLPNVNTAPKPPLFIFPAVFVPFFLIFSHGFIAAAEATCSVPKGWEDFTAEKPMRIGVPGCAAFEKFVKVDGSKCPDDNGSYTGFSIDVFKEVVKTLKEHQGRDLHYCFVPDNCSSSYDEMVSRVGDGTFDAVVGDVTILANRWKNVEFTQPYMMSELRMIVSVKSKENAWKFMKPFTMGMWVATGAILIYTMLIVWFLERESNPEFSGPWRNQLGTSLWFTFSSLFFTHRERIHNNYTRVVLMVWLFVVLVLTSSYTANLSSMLTVKRLETKAADIEWLKKNNFTVGCDNASFLMDYLKNDLRFQKENIRPLRTQADYEETFKNQSIKAALVELPYGKVLIDEDCKKYTFAPPMDHSSPTHDRRGGFGFVFPKGSSIAADVSIAILTLVENGRLKSLEDKLFKPFYKCSKNQNADETESLSFQSFWGLYLISGATSTLCFMLFLVHLLKNYRSPQVQDEVNSQKIPT